jgi:hypothetical protein
MIHIDNVEGCSGLLEAVGCFGRNWAYSFIQGMNHVLYAFNMIKPKWWLNFNIVERNK